MFLSLGMNVMAPGDPARSLAAVTQKWSLWAATLMVGLLASGVAVPFVVGIATRLRDAAPTRARMVLYVTLIGLAGHALGRRKRPECSWQLIHRRRQPDRRVGDH